METFLNVTVPEGPKAPWIHTDEGYDDMPAHCKASMMGSSVTGKDEMPKIFVLFVGDHSRFCWVVLLPFTTK